MSNTGKKPNNTHNNQSTADRFRAVFLALCGAGNSPMGAARKRHGPNIGAGGETLWGWPCNQNLG
eukprot:CAMPEP_0117459490 /NCGR_PEP_ID=MMETSP0784-20121206/1507_1 /TAXON_ID=39447 /ORGANISM="" /LENGTH=64 /DNA_ID=CAMNT_0005253109 /DNA_START=640 /DNA_END=831 /DNA_ORIENTATION=+